MPCSDAPVRLVAARPGWDLDPPPELITPQFVAGGGVQGIKMVIVTSRVNHTTVHDGRGLYAAFGGEDPHLVAIAQIEGIKTVASADVQPLASALA